MRRFGNIFVALLVLGLVGQRCLLAQAQGRAYGMIKDEQGNGIEGARIVLTDPSAKDYRVEVQTDKKGKYSLVILDATHTLTWHIEKEGFQTIESPRKIPAGGSTKLDIVLYPAGTAAGDLAAAAAVAKNREELEVAKKAAEAKVGAVEAFNAAVPLFNAGDVDGALAKLQEAVGLDPDLAPAHYVLGRIYERKGMLAEGIASAEKAIALNGDDVRSITLRYELLSRTGDAAKTAEALAVFKAKAPAAASKSLYDRGKALFDANQIREAKALLEDAVATDPANGRAYYELGLCHVNLNDMPKAKEALGKFVTLVPDDPEAPMAKEILKALK